MKDPLLPTSRTLEAVPGRGPLSWVIFSASSSQPASSDT